jgi:hypothetical protein
VLLDPAFYADVGELGGLSAPVVRSLSMDQQHATAVLGYSFAGKLNGAAAALLDPGKLSWAQIAEVDLAARRSEVTMVPDNYAGLFSFSGWYELRDAEGGTCCQHFEADLVVHVPLLGPLAERAIAQNICENVKGTARLVESYAARHR